MGHTQLQQHPCADLIPRMLQRPIVLLDNQILDGRSNAVHVRFEQMNRR